MTLQNFLKDERSSVAIDVIIGFIAIVILATIVFLSIKAGFDKLAANPPPLITAE